MIALRLHGRQDLRVEDLPGPLPPGPGDALICVTAAGICGSDLHTYHDGRIGDTVVTSPIVLGHEFAGVVEQCAVGATDGVGRPLAPGIRVAVDPATACGHCEMCVRGDPHLCKDLRFCGHYPVHGCFLEKMLIPARNCFPLPDGVSDEVGALLEPLGVAIHALRLAQVSPADRVAVFGAGPIGLMILQLLMKTGVKSVFAVEPLPWRNKAARLTGATTTEETGDAGVREILGSTQGRGVDVAIEGAWGGATIQDAANVCRPGGRIVLVGIPGDDTMRLQHSTGRRKELSLVFSRRMKHTYPEALRLVMEGIIHLQGLITHRFPLEEGPRAFRLNAAYEEGVVKTILVPPGRYHDVLRT